MSDPTTPGGPADPPVDPPAEGDDASRTNTSLGIVFGMLGLVLMLTLDDTRVAGLPFVVLGITFFVMGIRPAAGKRGTTPADGDPPPPPTA
jgi:succinate-acetate transporter protein